MNKPNGQYQDPVNRTFELYGPQIGEALTQLKAEDPKFGRDRGGVEARFDRNSVTGISFIDVKRLEAKVQELTGDPTAKLIRSFEEYLLVRGVEPKKVAEFQADKDKATLICHDQWLDRSYRIDKGKLILNEITVPSALNDGEKWRVKARDFAKVLGPYIRDQQ
ncbi:hypothetical protein HYX19_04340 [Candidatus Woesearchaeota archaeon]|nr:hypothetical protein [Candidatus Woesearchaeota archaeon]